MLGALTLARLATAYSPWRTGYGPRP
jgi:hypothetical protein